MIQMSEFVRISISQPGSMAASKANGCPFFSYRRCCPACSVSCAEAESLQNGSRSYSVEASKVSVELGRGSLLVRLHDLLAEYPNHLSRDHEGWTWLMEPYALTYDSSFDPSHRSQHGSPPSNSSCCHWPSTRRKKKSASLFCPQFHHSLCRSSLRRGSSCLRFSSIVTVWPRGCRPL